MEENQLDKAADGIYKELEKVGGDPLKLPSVLQPVAILYTVQAMVDNGGFRYLFENDFPFNPPYSVFFEAYRTIGTKDAADRLEKAANLFPFDHPEVNRMVVTSTWIRSTSQMNSFNWVMQFVET